MPSVKSMLLKQCISGAPCYQADKSNINVATRVYALATKAVKFDHQRLCVLKPSANASCICLHTKKSLNFKKQKVNLVKFQEIS